jgi:PTH1 family peptidyl-tRNA hydrolase
MSAPIELIVGLGNPGSRYADTRHNAGWWFVDELASRHGGVFREQPKFFGETAEIAIAGQRLRLLKPLTYMNESGRSVAAVANFYRYAPGQLLVAHDELDLPAGVARLKVGGGHGGHNGLRDLIAALGADFWRLRLGIDHPGQRSEVTDYVLRRASAAEETLIRSAVAEAVDVIPMLLTQGEQRAKTALHTRTKPARPAADNGAGE